MMLEYLTPSGVTGPPELWWAKAGDVLDRPPASASAVVEDVCRRLW